MPVFVKRRNEDNPREVEGDHAEENLQRQVLLVKSGDKVTGSFSLDDVESWWTEAKK